MDIVYKKVNAQITPEALAKLKQKKIIFESTNQQQLKGRYSIVIFDHYGKITLDNSQLLIKLDNHCEIIKNQPYQRLKELVDKYYFEIKDKYLKDLPFISGFIGTCSFDLVRHEFKKLQDIKLEDHQTHDVQFYLVEDVFVFDHYKDELYIIASNLFSDRTKERLKESIERKIEDLKKIHFSVEDIKYKSIPRHITTNISEQQFVQTIRRLKRKLLKEICFK